MLLHRMQQVRLHRNLPNKGGYPEITALLQECDALKAKLSSLRPLPVEALKKIEEAYNIEYTYESNRIEGNTLTLQETELVVNEGVTISGKSMREHLEAINHAEAIDYIRDFAKSDVEISEHTIKQIHALVLHGINRENAGRYRSVPVRISGSAHTPPQPYLLSKQMEDFMLRFGELEVDLGLREVRYQGHPAAFTTLEFDLLTFLARNPGQVFSYEQLHDRVWNAPINRGLHNIQVCMARVPRPLKGLVT